MKFAKERAQIIADQLKRYSVELEEHVGGWQVKEGCYIDVAEADSAKEQWKPFDNEKERWYGPDKHYWFRAQVTIPESMDGKEVWFLCRTQLEDWDDGRNPQFLVFIDGKVTQGLDINHREILLTKKAKGGTTMQIDMQSYTGTLHNEFRLLTDLLVINPETQALYYDIQVPLWSLNRMKENDRPRLEIEEVLTETVNLVDLRDPKSDTFKASVKKASEYIGKHLYDELTGYDEVIASCIGHTHIDVAWLWTVAQVRQKSCRSFATVLKLMEEYPNYHFMSSQPQLYKFVKERHPEEYARIKERIKEGRWEPEGGMWVEADCNLTSGESLVRQFLYGKRFFKEEFGKDNRILWLPDVFGYSGALPQIMKKCGIDYFMTTKLAWNQFNKIPFDTFMWEGIDGTKVFTHLITTLGVGQSINNFFTTYNGMLHPDAIMGGWERYQNKDINNDILVSYGFGDGGGGPTRQMLETSKRMEKGIKGVPKVRQVGSRQYFEELEARVKDSKRLPKWVGELYFEYHRGTYTSQGKNKRYNRKTEYAMMELEFISALAAKLGVEYPKKEMDEMWETILRNQFHDILPGSAIKEVYEVTTEEYEAIAKKITELLKERIAKVLPAGNTVTVYNTLGREREDIVELGNLTNAEALTDGKNVFPVQKTANGAIAFVKDIPSKGYVTLKETNPAGTVSAPFTVEKDSIETPFYTIKLDKCGQFASIFDKEANREVLTEGTIGNELRIYEDKPMCFSNWDIDVYYTEKSWPVTDVTSMEWTEKGPVRATLEIERHVMETVVKQKIHFYANTRRIDFETYVNWNFSEHLMKVHFPVDVHTDEATFDIQFGNLKRKIHKNTSWDVARFESCGHKWADLSEGGYGVSIMNDCKYGHSVLDGKLSLTLIKSGTEPDPQADRGEHFFTYSIYPHMGTWQEAGTEWESFNLNIPAKAVLASPAEERSSFMSVDKRNVVLETIKRAEDGDGIIVRLYETENTRSQVTVTCKDKLTDVTETNLVEEGCERSAKVDGNTFTFTIKPYEVKTFRIK
ncbi:MAG: alpha-mannosidase [Lachnospiraceae bacterium]|nr:alpha-mannosidase [Lachnospiraceae bacterium]